MRARSTAIRDTAVARIMSAHRFMFIAATAMLAVATSRVAADSNDAGSWILAVGAGIVMYEADVIGGLERASERLWHSAKQVNKPFDATRVDMFTSRAPRLTFGWLGFGWVCIVAGLLCT